MNEITKVVLENEMDLILAHKQSMRLAEITGLSLSAQTTFATAVSEISRSAIGTDKNPVLTLYVSDKKEPLKYIIAVLENDTADTDIVNDEGYKYAKRLVHNIQIIPAGNKVQIELSFRLPPTTRIDDTMVEKWRIMLNTDPAVSPYEEIKRKNRQLIEMADKLRESEKQYKSLTESLPIMIFCTTPDGVVTFANQWLYDYTGQTIAALNASRWEDVIHPDDFEMVWNDWEQRTENAETVVNRERRFKDTRTGDYRWHTGISIAITEEDGTISTWNTFMVDIHAQKVIEQTLKDNKELKRIHNELEEKVILLNKSNEQLEQFAYVASHDLQEPLRKISFYSDYLQKKYSHAIPEEAGMFFNNLINASDRMKILIQDVLAYSTVQKGVFSSVDLNIVAAHAVQDLEIGIAEKGASVIVNDLPVLEGNERQLKQLFENLISNSIKFSKSDVAPVITIEAIIDNNNIQLSFTDNGIGFDENHMDKMFSLFQRLHSRDQYNGTGIGLAICKKITDIHNGSITAKGTPDSGATFLITLPLKQSVPSDY